jgi:hypothetical protein
MVDQPQNCGKPNPKEETVLNIFDAYHKTKALAIFLIDVWWHQCARRLSQKKHSERFNPDIERSVSERNVEDLKGSQMLIHLASRDVFHILLWLMKNVTTKGQTHDKSADANRSQQ